MNPSLEIRAMRLDDAEGITAVLNPIIAQGNLTVLHGPFTVAQERAFLAAFPSRGVFHVAELSGRIVGFQVSEPFAPFSPAFDHVASIGTYVEIDSQHRGIGRQLAEATFAQARLRGFEKFLTCVLAENEQALRFYSRLGFEIIGVATRQAKLGERYHDEVLIEKRIL